MKRINIFFAILLLSYLCGSFYSVSFNISEWEESCRCVVIVVGLLIAFAVSSFPYIND
jgi:protein-S-isoprenylcysteine O-methyltransferase Ste14